MFQVLCDLIQESEAGITGTRKRMPFFFMIMVDRRGGGGGGGRC